MDTLTSLLNNEEEFNLLRRENLLYQEQISLMKSLIGPPLIEDWICSQCGEWHNDHHGSCK